MPDEHGHETPKEYRQRHDAYMNNFQWLVIGALVMVGVFALFGGG